MQRGLTGHYVPLRSAAGEKARAFVPHPLPPVPPLELAADGEPFEEKMPRWMAEAQFTESAVLEKTIRQNPKSLRA